MSVFVTHTHTHTHTLFDQALRVFISGEVQLDEDTCQDLLAAADMLGLSDVLEACCGFLEGQLHPSNCIGACPIFYILCFWTHKLES